MAHVGVIITSTLIHVSVVDNNNKVKGRSGQTEQKASEDVKKDGEAPKGEINEPNTPTVSEESSDDVEPEKEVSTLEKTIKTALENAKTTTNNVASVLYCVLDDAQDTRDVKDELENIFNEKDVNDTHIYSVSKNTLLLSQEHGKTPVCGIFCEWGEVDVGFEATKNYKVVHKSPICSFPMSHGTHPIMIAMCIIQKLRALIVESTPDDENILLSCIKKHYKLDIGLSIEKWVKDRFSNDESWWKKEAKQLVALTFAAYTQKDKDAKTIIEDSALELATSILKLAKRSDFSEENKLVVLLSPSQASVLVKLVTTHLTSLGWEGGVRVISPKKDALKDPRVADVVAVHSKIMHRMVVAPQIEDAMTLKAKGNEAFSSKAFEQAIDFYTEAIDACPELVKERAVLLSNRAACHMSLGNHEKVIEDCDKAVEIDSEYVKPLVRRARAHNALENIEEAFKDYQKILELAPGNVEAKRVLPNLKQRVDQKRKEDAEKMMGQLKDIGNKILGSFGLSLDNFVAKQDDKGGYSISMK